MSLPASPKTILITGATGGIGSALAIAYAGPGQCLILQGRNADGLTQLAARCQALGARVITQVLDVRQLEALTAWLHQVSAQERIDLVIVNAGVNTHVKADGSGEDWVAVQALIATNVLAAMATVTAVLPAMRSRGAGQVALVSSLAAYFGLPITPSYCASKAALKAYGEALRGGLSAQGICVNVVMPGYVQSPMCTDMPGPKPFLWTAEKAALAIQRGLARNQARISFPFPLNLGTWFLAVLPPSWSTRILQWLHYA